MTFVRFPRTVRARLTLWYTAALTLPLVVLAVASYATFATTLRSRTDAFLGDALAVFAAELEVERGRIPTLAGAVRTTVQEVRFQEVDILVLDDALTLLAESPPHSAEPSSGASRARLPVDEVRRVAGEGPGGPASVDGVDGGYRVLARSHGTDGRPLVLVGVYPLAEVDATLDRIRSLFLLVIPLLIGVAAWGGYFLAGRSLRPVSEMASRAAEIGASTLHERLPAGADDELGALAAVLNGLLDRLERSFEQQRRFMADASHELRTPTSIVRAEADVTLSRSSRTGEEYRVSMEIVQDASRRLTRIVDDIFLLARSDAGHLVMHAAPLYLEDLVRDAVRAVRPIADARDVRVELGDAVEGPLVGDPDLLGRLVLNLLDNAIKHAPAGSAIDVSVREREGRFELSVVDAGPGVPADARERIFERFYRVDSARARQESTLTSGAGLGLPICRRIAEMHGGTLVLASSRPGRTEFRFTLPGGPPPTARA